MASGVKNIKKKAAPPPRPVPTTPHFDFEREAFANGHRWVAGVDEVGRGPLAGPVGVAAVILDPDDLPEGLDDSKVLPAPARESLVRNHLRQGAQRLRRLRQRRGNRPLQHPRRGASRDGASGRGA